MKTLKIALIVALIATAMVNQANADGFRTNPKKSVHITLDRAFKDPGLIQALRTQVDASFLNTIEQLYIVEVKYNNVAYKILGSRQDWLIVFRPLRPPINYRKIKIAETE